MDRIKEVEDFMKLLEVFVGGNISKEDVKDNSTYTKKEVKTPISESYEQLQKMDFVIKLENDYLVKVKNYDLFVNDDNVVVLKVRDNKSFTDSIIHGQMNDNMVVEREFDVLKKKVVDYLQEQPNFKNIKGIVLGQEDWKVLDRAYAKGVTKLDKVIGMSVWRAEVEGILCVM